MRHVLAGALALCLLGSGGCPAMITDPLGRHHSLELTQREYTNMIRWGDVERADELVDPEHREAFLGFVPAFEDIRITDYEIGRLLYQPDETVTVQVTYRGYSLTTLIEQTIGEKQEWYRPEGMGNTWLVRPEIAGIANAFRAARR